jgi:hypothetical protein
LLGYDVIDDPKWRQTAFRFYWQALAPLPDDLKLQVVFVTPDGREVDSTGQRPLIQPLWYPPAAWPVGETQVTDKLPWFLPVQWAPAIGAYTGDGWDDRGARWQVVDAGGRPTFDDGTWAQLAPWQRQDGDLDTPPAPVPFETVEETFGGDGWTVQLSGVSDLQRAAPGASVPLVLRWQADTPAPRDYTIFVHLRDTEGRTLTQADAEPTWYGKQPTSQWPPGEAVLSAHELDLPPDLPPGVYEVVVGWYYWENGERLARLNQTGLPVGDGAVVARLEVDSTSGKRPDLACAVVPEACASR